MTRVETIPETRTTTVREQTRPFLRQTPPSRLASTKWRRSPPTYQRVDDERPSIDESDLLAHLSLAGWLHLGGLLLAEAVPEGWLGAFREDVRQTPAPVSGWRERNAVVRLARASQD